VAAARKPGNNRTQLYILAAAVVVIIAVIVFGFIQYSQKTEIQGAGYGASTSSTAAVGADGVIAVSGPAATGGQAPKTIELYEDALCPNCAIFEEQFGQQINQAVDEGKLVVDYRMLTFLDQASASGDYSTRASAALQCVAQQAGSQSGVFQRFHSALFARGTQPEERGSDDHSNSELAQIATDNGAGAAADCISTGADVQAAKDADATGRQALAAANGGVVGTPSVIHEGTPVDTGSVDWLTRLLAS
jgi:protein-disulfide isomerase